MKTSLLLAGGALVVAPLLLSAAPAISPGMDGVEVGSAAPEFGSERWFNHIGENPDLASLRGKAILIEFWATW